MTNGRMMGNYPKVGIRPTIDGRRMGMRESLENQTMGMAKSVSKLISDNIRYPDGSPVVCITADTTIGGVAEAAMCAEKFQREGVGVSITVTPCWCYGTETIDMDLQRPKAIWGFNGTERPGAVYLAAALAGHNQKGLPTFSIYGRDVKDANDHSIPEDIVEKLLRFTRAGLALAIMKGKSYLSIGSVSMGIAGSIVDDHFFQNYLGMRNEYVDMTEILRRITQNIFDKEEYDRALKWSRINCMEGKDYNPVELHRSRAQKDHEWETVVKMALITRDLMTGNSVLAQMGHIEESMGHNAIAAGFQGQRHWTDWMPNGDYLEAVLNSSFDWNGLRAPYIVATENDSLNGVSMLFGYLLTNTAQVFADVRTYWSPESVKRVTGHELTGYAENGLIHLINSGAACLDATGEQEKDGRPAMKPFWEISNQEVDRCLESTKWCPADYICFRGGGFSTAFKTRGGMPMTMVRVNIVQGLGPVLQLVEGYSAHLEDNVHSILDERTSPTWPTTWFAPILTGKGALKDVYSVMANWGANHGSLCYGHIGADLITLASMLHIPVCLHNVREDKVFRPSAWSAFGTKDPESADYRACANYGPLYGR